MIKSAHGANICRVWQERFGISIVDASSDGSGADVKSGRAGTPALTGGASASASSSSGGRAVGGSGSHDDDHAKQADVLSRNERFR